MKTLTVGGMCLLAGALLAGAFLAVALPDGALAASAPVPRASPELRINSPDGKTALLSGFRGKVVVVEFLFVKSQHCRRLAQTLNALQSELGPRGYQSIAIAFDAPNAASTGGEMLSSMRDFLALTYPVGYATRADVDTYLGRGANETLSIPQIVVIDRSGSIRAVTGEQINPMLEDIGSLRVMLNALLGETSPATGKGRS